MSLSQPFWNGKIGVVDLTVQSAYTVDLPGDALREHIGGAAMNAWLLAEYESDSIVFGTGPLTGSFAPASALLVGTFRSPVYDHLCHVPFMLRSGPEMKFSGVDYMVVRGAAKEPCALSVTRGQVRILPLRDSHEMPVPELLQMLRRVASGSRAAIVTGPAADRTSHYASASIDGHGSLDRVGLATRMAEKNIKALLFNGIQGLPFREDHPALAKAVEKMLQSSGASAIKGFAAVVRRLEDGGEAAGALRGKLGRNRACYHCPCPCMTHADYARPGADKKKDGILLMDHIGWVALSRKSEDALPLMHRCLELGLDPRVAGYGIREDGPAREALKIIESLSAAGASLDEDDYPSAPDIDSRIYRLFGGGIAPLMSGEAWTERVAASMILGICPIFIQIAGRLERSDLLRFLSSDIEEIKALGEKINGEISVLLEGKIPEDGGPGTGA
jgi:aldehyde:ferredoxin oxidoreductase